MTTNADAMMAKPNKLPPFREPLQCDVSTTSNCYSTDEMSASERIARQLLALLQHIHPSTVVMSKREDELTGDMTIQGLPDELSNLLPAASRARGGDVYLTVRFTREVIGHEIYYGARTVYPEGLEQYATETTYALVYPIPIGQLVTYGLVDEFLSLWDSLNHYCMERLVANTRAIDRVSEAVRWQLAGRVLKGGDNA